MNSYFNTHRLQLFHHVARHGGISAALPHVGYGLQQPALSAQMTALETELGVVLFQRRPFALTSAGERLYAFTSGFMAELPRALAEAAEAGEPRLRIAAADTLLRRLLPAVAAGLAGSNPKLRLDLWGGGTDERLAALRAGRLDLVAAEFDHLPSDLAVHVLRRSPIAVVAPAAWQIAPEEWWQPQAARPRLIVARDSEAVCAAFDAGLRERGIRWRPDVIVDTAAHVAAFAAAGAGVGLVLDRPGCSRSRGLQRIGLPEFRRITIAAVWRPAATPELTALLKALGVPRTRRLAGESS